jgi:hypothetical protein
MGLLFPPAALGFQAAQNSAGQKVQGYAVQSQQYKIAVQQALNGPFRVDVQPVEQGVKLGSAAALKVVLRNGNNQEVAATEKLTLIVTATAPSRRALTQSLDIAPGAVSGDVNITPKEAGLWKLEVRESRDHLKSGNNYLLVSSAEQKAQKSAARRKKVLAPAAKPPGGAFWAAPRLLLAAYEPPYLPPQGPSFGGSGPESSILLAVSGEGDGRVRADGKTPANISIFLTSPQSADVRIWLAVTQGQLATPMVTIKAGQVAAQVGWTSTTVGQARVSINNASPKIAGQEQASAGVEFVDPIVAIAFEESPATINIVELGTIGVRFVDDKANPVKTHAHYSYSFRSNSAHVRLKPESDHTEPEAFDFSASVTPTAFGKVTIEAYVPGYQPVQHSLEVTGFLLLGLCVLGGALGGLVNHFDRKQRGLAASLLTGMVVALPITWLYVWVGLPNVSEGVMASIMHNQVSAVMVAIIAGVSGASGLKLAAKKAGFSLFDDAPGEGQSSGVAA